MIHAVRQTIPKLFFHQLIILGKLFGWGNSRIADVLAHKLDHAVRQTLD